MKELTTVTQLIEDKISKHKLMLTVANENGDVEAFLYHYHQLVKMVAKRRKLG